MTELLAYLFGAGTGTAATVTLYAAATIRRLERSKAEDGRP